MAQKENKGGLLSNEDIEQDLKAKGAQLQGGYMGTQDTGDSSIRSEGSDVQKRNGLPEKDEEEE